MNNYSDSDIYGVFKMRVRTQKNHNMYHSALGFWKSVEQKYNERRQRWMDANDRMSAAKMAAMRARRELVVARRDAKEALHGGDSMENYRDARDDEFSDMDVDVFVDRDAQYYSSLDQTRWQRIRHDLMNIHRRAESEVEAVRRAQVRRLLCAAFLFLAVIVYAFMHFISWYMTPESVPVVHACPACDQPSFLDSLVHILVPLEHADDEV